jgi:hypothetical protein
MQLSISINCVNKTSLSQISPPFLSCRLISSYIEGKVVNHVIVRELEGIIDLFFFLLKNRYDEFEN